MIFIKQNAMIKALIVNKMLLRGINKSAFSLSTNFEQPLTHT